MSGGSMDYVFWRIGEAADHIAREAKRQAAKLANGEYPTATTGTKKRWYTKRDGSRNFLLVATGHHKSKALGEKTLQYLIDAYRTMRRAAVYAQRVEWLTSGDDGEQSFCKRLEEELAEVDADKDAWKDVSEDCENEQ